MKFMLHSIEDKEADGECMGRKQGTILDMEKDLATNKLKGSTGGKEQREKCLVEGIAFERKSKKSNATKSAFEEEEATRSQKKRGERSEGRDLMSAWTPRSTQQSKRKKRRDMSGECERTINTSKTSLQSTALEMSLPPSVQSWDD